MQGAERRPHSARPGPMLGAAVAIALMSAAAGLAPSGETGTAPTPQPATDPLDQLLTPRTRPVTMSADPAQTVEQALAYSDHEKIALADVSDFDGQVNGVALSILLRRAAMLPKGKAAAEEADRPNLKNLWRSPADYRGRLIQVEGLYAGRQDWSAATSPTTYYSGPVHMVLLQEEATGARRGIMVMMPVRPPEGILPGRKVSVAGLFYKVATRMVNDDPGKTADYAVIVAPGLSTRVPGAEGGKRIPLPLIIFGAAVVVLLYVFRFIWKRSRSRPAAEGGYKPRRSEETMDVQKEAPAEPETPDGDVDEDLIRQAEDFKDRKRKKTPRGDE